MPFCHRYQAQSAVDQWQLSGEGLLSWVKYICMRKFVSAQHAQGHTQATGMGSPNFKFDSCSKNYFFHNICHHQVYSISVAVITLVKCNL